MFEVLAGGRVSEVKHPGGTYYSRHIDQHLPQPLLIRRDGRDNAVYDGARSPI